KAKQSDVRENLMEEVTAELERAGTSVQEIETKAGKIVDEALKRDYPEARLRRLVREEFSPDDIRRMALGKKIYKDVYHPDFPSKPVRLTNQEYASQLAASKGRVIGKNRWEMPGGKAIVKEDGFWHHRLSKVDGVEGLGRDVVRAGKDIRRFY